MSEQPNVLLICTDHWPANFMGCAGDDQVITPTLDVMAASGVRFSNCYSECPVCVPARKTIMTGISPRGHGDRVYNEALPMPDVTTLAQAYRDAGYQAYAVGKIHTKPQRNRIGFDDIILCEEGRTQFGVVDDYETFLGEEGYAGKMFAHGMPSNHYETAPWHLPDHTHHTTWAAREMARVITRKDPTRPGFYYLSFIAPHPPLTPLESYMRMYDNVDFPVPAYGDWSRDPEQLPNAVKGQHYHNEHIKGHQYQLARRAFAASCTHIDHQIRYVIGTLREAGLLHNTIIMFTSDHGDMLGDHNLWAKRLMYERSANIPMIVTGTPVANKLEKVGQVNDRIVCWADVMPTLLDLSGIEIPETVEGMSMFSEENRDYLYGECGEGHTNATRMIRKGPWKLIYYSWGNVRQLFNVEDDPKECNDLAATPGMETILEELTEYLKDELYGGDLEYIKDGELVGRPDLPNVKGPNIALSNQRGEHFPRPSN